VRVLEDGRVKILDFGIAKLSGAETQLTRTGKVMGTAGYLSPEQLKGDPVDSRSDVFSFGVLAYELLSYEHPFPGTTISELLDRVVYSDPRPLPAVWPDCPPEIAIMIARSMDKDPERRYAGFPEVTEALSRVLAELDPTATPAALRRRDTDETMASANDTGAPPLPPPPGDKGSSTSADLEATQLVDVLPEGTGPAPDAPAGAARKPRPARGAEEPAHKEGDGILGRIILAVAVATLIALAAGVIWWIARSPQAGTRDDGAPATAGVADAEADVVVDAVPWGRLIGIEDASGQPLPLPPETTTPLTLHLPAGAYTLTLIHPESAEPVVCDVQLEPGATGRCRVDLLEIEAADYFEEAGWWQ
jgi:serine/threonine-protein kinase